MNTAQNLSQGARAILQAAAELFALDSFESVSVGAIAERAGVSKSNVFHHFASKEELFLAVMHEAGMSHAEFAERLLTESGACIPKLRRLIDFEIADYFANPQKVQLLLRALSTHSCGDGHQLAARIFNRNYRAVVALFTQGQASGELRSDFDTEIAAMVIGGANEMILRVHQYTLQATPSRQRKTLKQYVDTVFDLLLRGVIQAPTHVSNAPALLRKHGTRQRLKETPC